MVCSHANGITIGHDKKPLMEITDLLNLCRKYLIETEAKIFIFDTCYMGSLESLYEISKISDYILATASYHDGAYTFLQCPDVFIKHDDLVIWLAKLGNWYLSKARTYSKKLNYAVQWAIYSSEDIEKLGDYMLKSKLYGKLEFSQDTIIFNDDVNLHNFEEVLNYTLSDPKNKKLRKKINHAKLLLLKSYVYFDFAECDKKHNIRFCKMSIHENLPRYLPNEFNCKLELFAKTYCKNL